MSHQGLCLTTSGLGGFAKCPLHTFATDKKQEDEPKTRVRSKHNLVQREFARIHREWVFLSVLIEFRWENEDYALLR